MKQSTFPNTQALRFTTTHLVQHAGKGPVHKLHIKKNLSSNVSKTLLQCVLCLLILSRFLKRVKLSETGTVPTTAIVLFGMV